MFGGGISNKTSRLYQKLVEGELAVGVSGGLQATVDPFLYQVIITVRPDRSPEDVINKIDEEIDRLQNQLVSAEEIARAAKQARALFAYGSENITNQGFWLGFSEMFASYDWFQNYIRELEKVTPADIQQIAREYLQAQRRVVGMYIPDGKVKPEPTMEEA
jgi:zinc protease